MQGDAKVFQAFGYFSEKFQPLRNAALHVLGVEEAHTFSSHVLSHKPSQISKIWNSVQRHHVKGTLQGTWLKDAKRL